MSHWITRIPNPILRESLLLMRADRPIGTWLLMWPSLWALAAAQQGQLAWHLFAIFALGAFLMRSAGCVANDITDRDIDPLVARTRNRPLAAGRIPLTVAKHLLAGLLATAFLLALLLPVMALKLCIAGAGLAVTYPFAKRFIPIPQLYLGAAFAWGCLIAWAAATNSLPLEAWLLFVAALTWTTGFDTIYAMMDQKDDLKIGVQSSALFFGQYALIATAIFYLLTLLLLAFIGYRLHLTLWFYTTWLLALGQFLWQLVLIRHQNQEAILRAFLSNQWLGLILFVGFMLGR